MWSNVDFPAEPLVGINLERNVCKTTKYLNFSICRYVFQFEFMRCVLANMVYMWKVPTYQISETHLSCSMNWKKFMCVHMLYGESNFIPSPPHLLLTIHFSCTRFAPYCTPPRVCRLKWVFTPYSTSVIFRNMLKLVAFALSDDYYILLKKQICSCSLTIWVVRTHLQNVCLKMRPGGKPRALNTENNY